VVAASSSEHLETKIAAEVLIEAMEVGAQEIIAHKPSYKTLI